MFTGIITDLGKIIKKNGSQLTIGTNEDFIKKLSVGDSICLNGVCLTVSGLKNTSFKVSVIPETWEKTNLREAKDEDLVNLELPLTPNSFLSGHIVQGHVDGVAKLEDIKKDGNSRILKFSIPSAIYKFLVEKGTITVNGISLTVIKVEENSFSVGIIPFTWEHTMLKKVKVGDKLNIETDIIGKFVQKFVT